MSPAPEPFWQDEARVAVAAAVTILIGGYVVAAARLAYYRWRLRQAEQESARIAAQEPVSHVEVFDWSEKEPWLGDSPEPPPTMAGGDVVEAAEWILAAEARRIAREAHPSQERPS